MDVHGFARVVKRIVRLARSGATKKPHSWIVPFFLATPRHNDVAKSEIINRWSRAGLCSFFVPVGGRWKLTTPLAETIALFSPLLLCFLPPLLYSLCCPTDSSNLCERLLVVVADCSRAARNPHFTAAFVTNWFAGNSIRSFGNRWCWLWWRFTYTSCEFSISSDKNLYMT